MSDQEQLVDRLIHDAEHAEAGADFADTMARCDPDNRREHGKVAAHLREKAAHLRRMAAALTRAPGGQA